MPNQPTLVLSDVSLMRGSRTILHSLEGAFLSHEITALVGENGCGKSTLMQAMSGLINTSNGTISLCGRLIEDWQPKHLAKHRAVMMQSNSAPQGYFTEEILLLARSQAIETTTHSLELALNIAQWLGLEHLIGRLMSTLSGGEKQRIHLAKTLIQLYESGEQNPQHADLTGKVLLLDEPTSALDIRHQRRVMETLHSLAKQGLCIICICHDINLITPYCHQIYVLCDNTCIEQGPTADVINEATLSRCYRTPVSLIQRPSSPPIISYI